MNKEISTCQVDTTLASIAGKWKTVILFHLMELGTLRFNHLRKQIPEITQRMLTLQLRELEKDDIIKRVIYPEVPPRVEYSITPYGESLRPLLNSMHEWGIQHILHTENKREQNTIK